MQLLQVRRLLLGVVLVYLPFLLNRLFQDQEVRQ